MHPSNVIFVYNAPQMPKNFPPAAGADPPGQWRARNFSSAAGIATIGGYHFVLQSLLLSTQIVKFPPKVPPLVFPLLRTRGDLKILGILVCISLLS